MSANYAELERFRENLNKLNSEAERGALIEGCLKEAAARMLALVIKRTPVGVHIDGTQGGNLRRNWFTTDIKKTGNNYTITVYNNVEYASYVEYGHRQEVGRYVPAIGKKLVKGWVDGKFMLTVSENEITDALPSIAERHMANFLRGINNG